MMHDQVRGGNDVLGRAVLEKRQPTSRVLIPLGAAVAPPPLAITVCDNGVVPTDEVDLSTCRTLRLLEDQSGTNTKNGSGWLVR